MKYEFWKNIKTGDKLYFYDTDTWEINHFYIKDIKDRSDYSGSFILETTCDKHHYIYVYFTNFLNEFSVSTWNHSTNKQIYISNNRHELVNHYRNKLQRKVNDLENEIIYYQDLLDKIL